MPIKLVRKDNHSIEVTRTAEVVYGTCGIADVTLSEAGQWVIEYDGAGTTLNWNSQQQLKQNGKLIYVDENDNEISEHDIELIDVDEEEDDVEICEECEALTTDPHNVGCSLHPDNIVD